MSRMQLINASAGSGKTYTLARRYIEELLFVVEFNGTVTDAKAQYIIKALRPERDYYQHILAITFTNKATNEMKRRIVDELHTLAQNPLKSNFYTKEWKERLPHDISADDLRHAAAAALAAILFNYSEFRVSTIDSFFQSVLRSFARELNRDYDYDLQIDGDYAAAVAAHNFLLSLGNTARRTGNAKAEPEKWVEQYISDRVNDPTAKTSGWNTIFGSNEGSLAKFAAKINDEFFREHIDELKAYLAADKDAGVREFERITSFTRLLKEMANSCRRQYDDRKNDKDFWRDKFVARCKDVGLSLTDFNQRAALAKVYKTGICSESTMTKALNKPEPHKWFSSPTISQSQLDMALGYFGERLMYLSFCDFL